MELWLRIRDDSGVASALGLSDMAAAGAINDPALVEVMVWALTNPAPLAFREHAAWSLPWVQPTERTLAQFTEGFRSEPDPRILEAYVDGLAKMKTPAAREVLLKTFLDRDRRPVLRAMIVTELEPKRVPVVFLRGGEGRTIELRRDRIQLYGMMVKR